MIDDGDGPTSLVLLNRARAGDEAALDLLCRRYIPRLENWAAGRLPAAARDLRDTADVVQEALIKAIRNLDRFEFRNDAALLVYLRHAVMNRIRDEVRRARRSPDRVGDLTSPGDARSVSISPLHDYLGVDTVDRYERALQKLQETDRELVIAMFELGADYEEMARLVGKPTPHAARVAASRALARLAREMDSDD